jgi:hypothetical protein
VITDKSQRNLESAFHKAVRANLVREPSDVCEISPADISPVGDYAAEKMFLITLSTFVFRLVMIFRVGETRENLHYYARVGATQALDEVFAEVANMCGGSLNHALSSSFPHLAMSTPCTVSGPCIEFLSDMKPQYVASFKISINDAVKLQATLCLCCSGPLEVADSSASVEADQTVGELEMF